MKTDSSESPEIIVPLGQALKDARLVASLSIDEVAEQLNLGGSTVRDLEDNLDDVLKDKKYPTIYLRGYLSNYAKLVGLNTLELFLEYQQLESRQKGKKTLKKSELLIPIPKKRTKRLPLLLLLILVVALAVYFFQKPLLTLLVSESMGVAAADIQPVKNKEAVATNIIIPGTIVSQIDADKNNDAELEANSDSSEISAIASPTASPTPTVTPTITPTPAVTPTPVVVPVVIENMKEERVVEDNTPEEVVENVAEEIVEEVATEASFDAFEPTEETNSDVAEALADDVAEEEVIAPPTVESLSLAFTAECWTEVFDATGKRIAFGLYKNGRVLMLSGMAPFQLKLGDPSVVEIQYQDQIIEGEFTPGRSAQFSVPLS